jgi:hypothetical protein
MSVEATIKINDKFEKIKVVSNSKEQFLKEFVEQLQTQLSTINDGEEITGIMRMVTIKTTML